MVLSLAKSEKGVIPVVTFEYDARINQESSPPTPRLFVVVAVAANGSGIYIRIEFGNSLLELNRMGQAARS